jgi:rubrerythrin
MKNTSPMGMNRTGLQMSPFDSSAMQAAAPPVSDTITGDASAVSDMRSSYTTESEPIGSVPIPATVSGALSTGMSMLSGQQPQILIDKLGERLAFERAGTRLYDALIAKFDAMDTGDTSMQLHELQRIRADEARHFTMIAAAIESIGGDPTAQTPSADLVGVEALGLIQVVTDPRTTLAQSLHAMLTAELSDRAGWEVLMILAEQSGQAALNSDFAIALQQEQEHLELVQKWYREALMGRDQGAADVGEPAAPVRSH